MNLCIGSFTYICIISCVIVLPFSLGQNTSTDKISTGTKVEVTSTTVAENLGSNTETTTAQTTASTAGPTTKKPDSTTSTSTTTAKPDSTTAPNTTTSTTVPPTSPATPIVISTTPQPLQPCRRFDGPSFIGGTVFSMGLLAISFICYKFYKARNERNYHTL